MQKILYESNIYRNFCFNEYQRQTDGWTYQIWTCSKAPKLDCEPKEIKAIDCSGFVRYLIYKATQKQTIMPDGSWNQRVWCDNLKLSKIDYGTSKEKDGWLRIAFIQPKQDIPGHVWLVLDGATLESRGLTKGPDHRAWDTASLKNNVYACYKLAQTFTQHRNIDIRHLA